MEIINKEQNEIIQKLRNERSKFETIFQEEKKKFENLKFELLTTQTLVEKIKKEIEMFDIKVKEGNYIFL